MFRKSRSYKMASTLLIIALIYQPVAANSAIDTLRPTSYAKAGAATLGDEFVAAAGESARVSQIRERLSALSPESIRDLDENAEGDPIEVAVVGLMCADKIHSADRIIDGMERDGLKLIGGVPGSIDPDGSKLRAYLESLPEDLRNKLSDLSSLISGGPANSSARVCAQLSRPKLGGTMRVSFISNAGKDGMPFIEAHQALGVDTTHIKVSDTKDTSYTLVFEHGEGVRSFAHYIDAASELEVTSDMFKNKKVVLFGGIELTGLMQNGKLLDALKMAKAEGAITVLDTVVDQPHQWKDYDLDEMLKYIDVFCPSKDEAKQIMEDYLKSHNQDINYDVSPEQIVDFFTEHGANATFLKWGKDGSYIKTLEGSIFRSNTNFRAPIYDGFTERSGTGTGDAFVGGLVYAVAHDWNPEKTALFASAVGGMCVQYNGGTLEDETLVDALYFMELIRNNISAYTTKKSHTKASSAGKADMSRMIAQAESGKVFAVPASSTDVAAIKDQIRLLELPDNPVVAVVETEKGHARLFAGDFIRKLESSGAKVKIYTLLPNRRNINDIGKYIKQLKPDILISPSSSNASESTQLLKDVALKAVAETASCEVSYETLDALDLYNFYFAFGQRRGNLKLKAIRMHESQDERLPFSKAARASNVSDAHMLDILMPGARPASKRYAEKFNWQQIVDGRLQPPLKRRLICTEGKRGRQDLPEFLQSSELNTFLFLSPHPDDAEIAAAAFLSWLIERGDTIANIILTTGHGVDMPEGIFEKFVKENKQWLKRMLGIKDPSRIRPKSNNYREIVKYIREQEVTNAGGVLGILKSMIVSLRCGFYDRRNPDGSRIIAGTKGKMDYDKINQAIKKMYREHKKKRSTGRFVVAIPQQSDRHPDHQATYTYSMEVLKELSEREHITIDILTYVAPWAGEPNLFNYTNSNSFAEKLQDAKKAGIDMALLESVQARMDAYAIVGTELVAEAGFGAAVINRETMGSQYAERLFFRSLTKTSSAGIDPDWHEGTSSAVPDLNSFRAIGMINTAA